MAALAAEEGTWARVPPRSLQRASAWVEVRPGASEGLTVNDKCGVGWWGVLCAASGEGLLEFDDRAGACET